MSLYQDLKDLSGKEIFHLLRIMGCKLVAIFCFFFAVHFVVLDKEDLLYSIYLLIAGVIWLLMAVVSILEKQLLLKFLDSNDKQSSSCNCKK